MAIQQADYPLPVEKTQNFIEKYRHSILNVTTLYGQGTAGFYILEELTKQHYCIISCFHVFWPKGVNQNDNDVYRANFNFDKERSFRLLQGWIACFKFSKELDYIAIEIKEEYATYQKSMLPWDKSQFIYLHQPNIGDKVCHIK